MDNDKALYAVKMTGVLGDTWLSGYRGTREEMQRYANFILNKGFDSGRRAGVVAVKVVRVFGRGYDDQSKKEN